MHNRARTLVVGATTDYVNWIRSATPGRALFLTDAQMRKTARESPPSADEEALCDLSDYDEARQILRDHLASWRIELEGLACFDCESMELAAIIAEEFDLPYPSVETIRLCRDKFLQKRVWRENGVPCPQVRMVRTSTEAVEFRREIDGPCVLKPLTGSGSELVFLCADATECREGFGHIHKGLEERQTHRMYRADGKDTPLVVAEEYIRGVEYSCDFIVENGEVEIIRVTRKILAPNAPFGTIRAYHVAPDVIEDVIAGPDFLKLLCRAANTLGIATAICMADFMVRDNEVVLLEMTPRPGGDCLPAILRESADLDILTATLDFASDRPVPWKDWSDFEPCIGVRIHAEREGALLGIQTRDLEKDPRVLDVSTVQVYGHVVQLPPQDYDSWLLGHVIFRPDPETPPDEQCEDILKKVKVSIV